MRLIPKAKPVRIRITVGNEEHNSLESLQENYVWHDIISLLDGRLIKWLRRINANSIADNLAELHSPADHPLEVYNILFRNDAPFVDREDVFREAEQNQAILPLAEALSNGLTTVELLEYGKAHNGIAVLFAKSLVKLCEQFSGNESGKELFEIGEFLFSLNYKEEAKNCINLAAKRGLREANDFKKAHFNGRKSDENLESILARQDILENIIYSWKTNTTINLFGTREPQKYIFDFSNSCLLIFERSKQISNSDDLRNFVDSHFELISSDDPLFSEKTFVRALFDNDFQLAIQRLKKISYYSPAKAILESGKFVTEGHVFQPCKGFTNAAHLRYYITHLLNFRKSR